MTTAHGHPGSSVVGPQQPQGWVLFLALCAITAVGIAVVALVVNRSDTPASQEIAPAAVDQTALTSEQLGAINHLLAHEAAIGTAAVGTGTTFTSEQIGAINHLLAHEAAFGTAAVGASTALTGEQLAAINHLLAHEAAFSTAPLTGEQLGAINHLLAHESAIGAATAVGD